MGKIMTKRIMTATVALGVMAPFLIFSDTYMLLIFSGGLSVLALYEVFDCIGFVNNPFITIPTFIVSVTSVIMTRTVTDTDRYFMLIFIIFFIYIVYLITVSVFSRGTVRLDDVAIMSMSGVYIIFGFSSIVLLRDLEYGEYIYLLAFLAPWISDSFAYFIGVRFGKHKLIPDVSPKKTIEGAVGGIVFGTASVALYGFIIGRIFTIQTVYPALIAVGFIMCILSQCGDLIASLIKRHYNKKDYGNVFPGHGGVMDRFDSIIITAPFLYFLFILSPLFEIFF
jgi:phosphatidate cytidylyltransferase